MWLAIRLAGAASLIVTGLAACEPIIEESATNASGSTGQAPSTTITATITTAASAQSRTPTTVRLPNPELPTNTLQTPSVSPTALPFPTPEPFNLEIEGRHCSEFPLQSAVQQAGVIAVGTVKEVLPSRWTTEDGERPPPPWQFGIPDAGIVTPILFEAEEYLKGEEAGAELLFYVDEGTVGQDSIKWGNPILPSLPAGARAVVFLVKQQYRFSDVPLWKHLDHYSLTAEGQAIDSCQIESMPQEELFAEIRAAAR